MAINLPRATADQPDNTLRLRDLQDIVRQAESLDLDPDHIIVRGTPIPFKMSDLGNDGGMTLQKLALDVEEV